MTEIYVMLAICLALGAAAVALCVVLMLKKRNGGADISEIKQENEKLKADIVETIKMNNSMLTGSLNTQNDNSKRLEERFDRFMLSSDDKLDKTKTETAGRVDELRKEVLKMLSEVKESLAASISNLNNGVNKSIREVNEINARNIKEVRDDNNKNLQQLREDNSKQLEKMRETVDEKLNSTLESRFNQSFKIVNDRLEEINRTFAELQNLQSGVNDLNKIFKNVKTRGTWGEVSLESLLSQILAPEQYDKQVRIKRGSDDAVDFAVRMPGKGDGSVLLPIDAKFPIEDYARISEAAERADGEGVEAAVKALAQRVKLEAKSIRDKYINPPKTTDFAIMYLPTEGLYAEVVKRNGLVEEIQANSRVVICGPTTIAALLNSLQMGFRSVAVEKHSAEIRKLLQSFTKDFNTFSELLAKTGNNIDKVRTTISNAEKRTDIIRKKLEKVGTLEQKDEGLLLEADLEQEVAADEYFDNESEEIGD